MRETVRRKFWQIHFSTALAVMMTCAFLLGSNLTQTKKLFVWPEGVYTSYGWPFDVCLLRGDNIQMWNYFGLACNLIGAVAIIGLIAAMSEWYTRFQLYERAPRRNNFNKATADTAAQREVLPVIEAQLKWPATTAVTCEVPVPEGESMRKNKSRGAIRN
jgi:hypothetical protein